MADVDAYYERLRRDTERRGYRLNPDAGFTKSLIEGLMVNGQRYGYEACPCRLASGRKVDDLDIICPCDYRDTDMDKYGACYCGLYVSEKVYAGEQKLSPIPESRQAPENRKKAAVFASDGGTRQVWRCKVCGYLCARDSPPEKCPICLVGRERFEPFA